MAEVWVVLLHSTNSHACNMGARVFATREAAVEAAEAFDGLAPDRLVFPRQIEEDGSTGWGNLAPPTHVKPEQTEDTPSVMPGQEVMFDVW